MAPQRVLTPEERRIIDQILNLAGRISALTFVYPIADHRWIPERFDVLIGEIKKLIGEYEEIKKKRLTEVMV
jgi:hypothetical protein